MSGILQDPDVPLNGHSGRVSLVREYFGTEPHKLLYLAGFLVGVLVVVTVPYVSIVGWSKWKSDMGEASHMIWAGYTPAAGTAWPQGPDPGSPYTVVPAGVDQPLWLMPPGQMAPPYAVAPAYAQPYAVAPAYMSIRPAAARQQVRQYVCPSCGTVAPPAWTAYGQPVCPVCGGPMAVGQGRLKLDWAAAP